MKGCRPLTDEEVKHVQATLESHTFHLRDKALFLVGLRSGFRISELLSLRIRHILQNNHFVDHVSVERKNMKGKKAGRTVALHPEARQALEVWVRELMAGGQSDPDTFVFQSREGQNKAMHRNTALYALKKAYKVCGLTGKLGTHSMRKTFAKRVHDKLGRDLMKTQKALGHARVTSTVSYLSFAEEEIEDAILKS